MITVYGKSLTCSGCIQLKEYLDKHEIEYEYKDLEDSDKKLRLQHKREFMKLNANYIPVIVDGEEVIIGFDKIVEYLEHVDIYNQVVEARKGEYHSMEEVNEIFIKSGLPPL